MRYIVFIKLYRTASYLIWYDRVKGKVDIVSRGALI